MEPVRPNAYLRCESRRPALGLAHGLWRYGLALVIVASASIDALWLAPASEPDAEQIQVDGTPSRAPHASAYRDAIRHRCRVDGRLAPAPSAPPTR